MPDALGPAGVGEHGIGTTGFPRNLGGPDRLPAITSREGDRLTNPRPAVSALDRWERNDRRSAGYTAFGQATAPFRWKSPMLGRLHPFRLTVKKDRRFGQFAHT